MSNQTKLLQIRKKKLGLLIFDARKATRRSVEECAEAAGVTVEQFQTYEKGAQSPSLPQLELLALFFNVPVEHFWGRQALSEAGRPEAFQEKDRLVLLRNRVIGTNLRLARANAGLTHQEMAGRTGIAEERISHYESGGAEIPVTELELIANALDTPVERFYDQHGPIGRWRAQQGSVQKFLDLPPDIQQFVAKPVNRPYLELAIRLSELSAEKLRAVAEVLLEITY
jgi:transcriptional regulator with XRE-family HTH domain